MKFKNYLETISGISIYPLISLMIFVSFFAGLLWYVFKMSKQHVKEMESVPMDDGTIRKSLLTIFGVWLISPTFAQGAETTTPYTQVMLYTVLFVLGVVIVILLVILGQVIVLYQKIIPRPHSGQVPEEENTPLFSAGWWQKFAGFATPLNKEEKILLAGHEYDGIHELDNRMPPWLQFLFVGTLGFAIGYSLYYHAFGFGDFQIEELNKELAMADVQKQAYIEKMGAGINEENVALLTEGPMIKEGGVIFTEKCTACHAADGGGGVGPNLTDNYWLHGGDIKDVFKVIKYGVPEKGMISWEKQLPPQEIQQVASFILAELHGSTPAAPKAPQGKLYEKPTDVPLNPMQQVIETAKSD